MDREQILVCPFDQNLIRSFKKKALVIETEDPNQVRHIARELSRDNKLHAIRLTLTLPLSELKIEDDWRGIPLVIYSSDIGDFKKLIHQMNALRQLNVVIFLGNGKAFNLTGLQILSSLQIPCGLVMEKESNTWEETLDLMHYAIYGRTKHAQVEPFNYIATQYGPGDFLDYDTVYFDNPEKFLHLNESGQVALNSSNLSAGTFISDKLENLELKNNESYLAHVNKRYEAMLSMNDCAFCPSFRICLGKFSDNHSKEQGCKKFFSEMIEAADFFQTTHKKNDKIWQW